MQPSINQVSMNIKQSTSKVKRIEVEPIEFVHPWEEDHICQTQKLFHKIKRNPVKDIQQKPYYCMGENDFYRTNGTAILVTPDIILTCAHNVFNKEIKKQAHILHFYLGVSGNKQLHSPVEIKKQYVFPESYKTSEDNSDDEKNNDWAFLVLKDPINVIKQLDFLPIIADFNLQNYQVGVYGYPNDKISKDYPNMFLYGASGPCGVKNGFLQYIIDTNIGQSGSALITSIKDQIVIIGIHIKGLKTVNLGNILTGTKMVEANQLMGIKYLGKTIPYKLFKQ